MLTMFAMILLRILDWFNGCNKWEERVKYVEFYYVWMWMYGKIAYCESDYLFVHLWPTCVNLDGSMYFVYSHFV